MDFGHYVACCAMGGDLNVIWCNNSRTLPPIRDRYCPGPCAVWFYIRQPMHAGIPVAQKNTSRSGTYGCAEVEHFGYLA